MPKKKQTIKAEEPLPKLQKGTSINELQQFKSNLKVKAKLNNFQIWIPLQATSINSQIMNLSFMSEFNYMKVMDLTGANAFDSMQFNLGHFVVSMINLMDNFEPSPSEKDGF